jgi:predicted PolB exonuclease-like 3'-5' exonuclease
MKDKSKEKAIKSFKKQKEKHEQKIKEYSGKNYALIEYW